MSVDITKIAGALGAVNAGLPILLKSYTVLRAIWTTTHPTTAVPGETDAEREAREDAAFHAAVDRLGTASDGVVMDGERWLAEHLPK